MVKKGGKKSKAGGGSKKGKGGKGKGGGKVGKRGKGKGGKGGKRNSKFGKGIRVIQKTLDQTTKEFYLWQIQLLEEKVGRYQKQNDEMVVNQSLFQAKFDKCVAEKNDLIAFLKCEMNKKYEAYTDLREKYLTLTQVLDNEQEQCRKKMASLTKQADENQAQIVAENMALTSKIAALEEFRIKRFQLMSKLTSLQAELDEKTKEFTDKIMVMEHKFLVSKHTLKSEMIEKVKSVAAEFRKHSERNLNVTMTRTIQENVRTNTQLAKLSDKTVTLIDENTKQTAEMNELKHQLYLSELEGKDFSKKFQTAMDSMIILREKCVEQVKLINQMRQTYENCDSYVKDNEVLKEELHELQEENEKLISENKYLNKINLKLKISDVLDKDQKEEMEQLFFNSVSSIREALDMMAQISAEAAEAIKMDSSRAPTKLYTASHYQQPEIDSLSSSVEINGSKDYSDKYSFKDAENASEAFKQVKTLSFDFSEDKFRKESIAPSPFDIMDSQHGHQSLTTDDDIIPEDELFASGMEATTHKKVSISQKKLRMGMEYKHAQVEYQPRMSLEDFSRPGWSELEKNSRKTSALSKPGLEQQPLRDTEKHTSDEQDRADTERAVFTKKPESTHRVGSLEPEVIYKKLKETTALYIDLREKILEALVLIIKSATSLGIRNSIQSEPVMKTQRSISFAPKKEQEIPRPMLTPVPLRRSSVGYSGDRRSFQLQNLPSPRSKNMDEMFMLCSALSSTLQKSKLKTNYPNMSQRKIYTQEDMLEYMMLFIDSTAQMGPEVQEKQINNLWTYAQGEVPPQVFDARRRASIKMPTIYKSGDLGFVPSPQITLPKKVDCIRMDQKRLKLSLRMDVATKTVATQTLVFTEQRVLHALSINSEQTAGLMKYKDGNSVAGLSVPVPSKVMSKNFLKQSLSFL